MNNDRELLEQAAKAAGIEGKIREIQVTYTTETRIGIGKNRWNPLESDADALRLAVKLEMDLSLGLNGCVVLPDPNIRLEELSSDDPYAATRRAIVRAAAEIGKDMK
jgi:hypothetical protein